MPVGNTASLLSFLPEDEENSPLSPPPLQDDLFTECINKGGRRRKAIVGFLITWDFPRNAFPHLSSVLLAHLKFEYTGGDFDACFDVTAQQLASLLHCSTVICYGRGRCKTWSSWQSCLLSFLLTPGPSNGFSHRKDLGGVAGRLSLQKPPKRRSQGLPWRC